MYSLGECQGCSDFIDGDRNFMGSNFCLLCAMLLAKDFNGFVYLLRDKPDFRGREMISEDILYETSHFTV